jgi:hypothetical protein
MRIKKPKLPRKPNHSDGQWYKLCALLMFKLNIKEVSLTVGDMERFKALAPLNVVYREEGDTLTMWLLNDEETLKLATDDLKTT